MPGTMSNVLKQREQQYVSNRDDTTGAWRILNCWHEDIKNLDIEDDIPDDHPAVTLVTEGAFLSLFREALSKGYDFENREMNSEELNNLQSENEQLKKDLENKQRNVEDVDSVTTSEKFLLNQQKLHIIEKYLSTHGASTETNGFIEALTRVGGNEEVDK